MSVYRVMFRKTILQDGSFGGGVLSEERVCHAARGFCFDRERREGTITHQRPDTCPTVRGWINQMWVDAESETAAIAKAVAKYPAAVVEEVLKGLPEKMYQRRGIL